MKIISETDRLNLPFRMNCEGYFFIGNKILVKDGGKGFLIFPGGGIESNESPEEGMIRETKEETKANITDLKLLGNVKFVWGKDWAKTDKQKNRYESFQGDEMFFFSGKVLNFDAKSKEEDLWDDLTTMSINEITNFIEKSRPFVEGIKDYREAQLRFLSKLKEKIE